MDATKLVTDTIKATVVLMIICALCYALPGLAEALGKIFAYSAV